MRDHFRAIFRRADSTVSIIAARLYCYINMFKTFSRALSGLPAGTAYQNEKCCAAF